MHSQLIHGRLNVIQNHILLPIMSPNQFILIRISHLWRFFDYNLYHQTPNQYEFSSINVSFSSHHHHHHQQRNIQSTREQQLFWVHAAKTDEFPSKNNLCNFVFFLNNLPRVHFVINIYRFSIKSPTLSIYWRTMLLSLYSVPHSQSDGPLKWESHSPPRRSLTHHPDHHHHPHRWTGII